MSDMEPLHALAKKWDANAARNQRNGQSLLDQGDEYGSEGLAIAEALGACVVDLRAVLADYETDTDAQPAPDFRALIRDNLIPEPAPELAAAMAETRGLRELVADMLAAFTATGSGHAARVGQIQIAKWRERAGLPK